MENPVNSITVRRYAVLLLACAVLLPMSAWSQLELHAESPKSQWRHGEPVRVFAAFQNLGDTAVYVPKKIVGNCPAGFTITIATTNSRRHRVIRCSRSPAFTIRPKDTLHLAELIESSWQRIEPYGAYETSLVLRPEDLPKAGETIIMLKYRPPELSAATQRNLRQSGIIVAAGEYRSKPLTLQIDR